MHASPAVNLITGCLLILLAGCNGDLFLDGPDIPIDTFVTVTGDGGEMEFAIPPKGLKQIALDAMSDREKYCTYYNTQGEIIDKQTAASQLGSIVFETDLSMFILSKVGGKLTFKSLFQTLPYDLRWTIRLEYEYGMRFIHIEILSSKSMKLL